METAFVLEQKRALEQEWAKARKDMLEVLALYNLTFPVRVEEDFQAVRPPTAPRVVNTAVDHVLVGNEVVIVPPVKETEKGQGQADKLERYYASLSRNLDTIAPEPLLRSLTRAAMLFGAGIIKGPFWSPDAPIKPERGVGERGTKYKEELEEWEAQRRGVCPIIFRLIDPRQILFPVDTFPPPFFIEVGQRTARSIWDTFKVEIPHREPHELVNWIEYWDKDERLFLADDISILPQSAQQNIGGYIPFVPVFSGLGRVPSLGGGSSLAPDVLCKSILWDVRESIPREAELQSALDAIIELHAYPRYVLPREGALQIHWGTGPGGLITVPSPDYKLTLLEMPRTLPDVYQRLSMIREEIEQATFSGVLEGKAPPGIRAGYPMAILIGQARVKFGVLIFNLERAKERMLSNTSRLLEALDESLTIFGKTPKGYSIDRISSKDIQGHYDVQVTLSGVTPEEADRRGLLGLQFLQAGAISHRTFLEDYSLIADVTGELKQIMVERMLKSPGIQEALSQEALEAWGGLRLQAKIKEGAAPGAQPGAELPAGAGMVPGGGGMLGGGMGPPQRATSPGGPEGMSTWIRRLQRLGGTEQGVPIGGPREEIQ